MNAGIEAYNQAQSTSDQEITNLLATIIDRELPQASSKIWHGHPVWFLNDNPTVGYSKQKAGIRLMFWSGADFEEPALSIKGGKFKDASVFYNSVAEIAPETVGFWLKKATEIQWDYKNLVKRKGVLERLT